MEEDPRDTKQASEDDPRERYGVHPSSAFRKSGIFLLIVALLAAAGIGLGYSITQHRALTGLQVKNQALASTNQNLGATINQMESVLTQLRGQVGTLNSKLTAMKARRPVATRRTAVRRARVISPLQRLQAKLNAQQSQLDQMKTQVAQDRSALEGELGSTRDTLNGGIARNHEELVALEKRGERNYYEFDLTKAKQFQRFGPVLLSLRKADSKHQHYNMMMLVDDKQLMKKNVNLDEPVWIYRADDPGPTQIVVNEIGKNYVHGYVSAPKYTKADLAASQPQPSSEAAPAGQTTETPQSNENAPAPGLSQPAPNQNVAPR